MAGTKLRLAIVAAAAAALFAQPAAAQDCDAAQTQADMTECSGQDYKSADKALNAEYKRAEAALDKSVGLLLRDAQRAWISFRDKACKAEGALYGGGSMQPMVIADCMTRLTQRRTEDLKLLSQTN